MLTLGLRELTLDLRVLTLGLIFVRELTVVLRELTLDLRVLTLGLLIFCERASHISKGTNPRFYLQVVGGS